MNLRDAVEGKEYVVRQIDTEDEDLNAFLFSLGCYSGEHITVVSHLKGGCIVSIKDGRYNMTINWPTPSSFERWALLCVFFFSL